MSKRKALIALLFSFITGSLAMISVSGLCCTLAGAALISSLGLIGLSSYLYFYQDWLLILSIIFFIIGFWLLISHKSCPNCKIRNKKHKKNNK